MTEEAKMCFKYLTRIIHELLDFLQRKITHPLDPPLSHVKEGKKIHRLMREAGRKAVLQGRQAAACSFYARGHHVPMVRSSPEKSGLVKHHRMSIPHYLNVLPPGEGRYEVCRYP